MAIELLSGPIYGPRAHLSAQYIATARELRLGAELSSRRQESKRIHLKGVLVSGGAECPRFRATDNRYYTLEGDLHGFKVGDAVEITVEPVDRSHCMQDTTVRIITIERAKS